MDKLLLTINKPHVNSEIFDDEVVVVNLLNGFYYSLSKSGMDVWILIERKFGKEQIINSFLEKYPDQPVQKEISEFINELVKESLINEVLADSNNSSNLLHDIKRDYKKPVIEKYSDMQDLLMLDPIHDIDETGWPQKSAEMKKKDVRKDKRSG